MNKLKNIAKKMFDILPHSSIYMFHHVSSDPTIDVSSCKLDTKDFYDFIINKKNNIVSIEKILGNKASQNGKHAITFDDGISDVYSIAYPFLKDNNIPFTIFILTEMLDKEGYITTENLIELSKDSLVTIGAHGTNHRILTQLSKKEKEEEIIEGKLKLETLIEKKVEYFAYSHGCYDKEAIEIVKRGGFSYALSVRELPVNIFSKVFKMTIPRYNVDSTTIHKYIKCR